MSQLKDHKNHYDLTKTKLLFSMLKKVKCSQF